ncbi:hypothetical protein SARC_01139 [Sphaeroforma arctica JP610]|uniref:Uncharacterized protein n=1 Tax=Sphaeroforma arctica JP610 TaxID=667725 RepID=A0A0L0GCT6_9EUKA|nr:hypothetical protein SARC_01139 [Sphaeroforma arctica JP610]KNC86719.1 hypothetical protein SARC_01139 [Sphaeroforma arctica JP610]|eukprot:XP_014160621.1 hypothetical protein SARC_01139 [Sphaeroforma arctica JP610]
MLCYPQKVRYIMCGVVAASSLPACVFEWSVENYGDTTAEVAICMTWVNGYGAKDDKAGGHQNYVFSSNQQNGNGTAFGIEMKHKTDGGSPYSFGISALQPDDSGETYQVTYEANFTANGSGSLLWNQLLTTGHLKNGDSCQASRKGQVIGAAVSCSVQPKPSETVGDICFTLTWDSPEVDFPKSDVIAHRQYTRYFGNDGRACAGLCSTATQDYRDWEKKIDDWQSPILNDSELPDWYKSALFNESYFVADGGTVWLADKEDEIGRFGYLEGHEYRMVNTYDVHFYASWALTLNWPKIASSIQRDYADAKHLMDYTSIADAKHRMYYTSIADAKHRMYYTSIADAKHRMYYTSIADKHPMYYTSTTDAKHPMYYTSTTDAKHPMYSTSIADAIMVEDKRSWPLMMGGTAKKRTTKAACPHDLGDPQGNPWVDINCYNIHDTATWKVSSHYEHRMFRLNTV